MFRKMFRVFITSAKPMNTISEKLFFPSLPTMAVMMARMAVVSRPETAVPTVNLETTS